MHFQILLTSLFAAFLVGLDCSKILVFSPTIMRSHMISNGRVADALAKDGHNVTLLEVEYIEPLGHFNASKFAQTFHVHGPFFRLEIIENDMADVMRRGFEGVSPWEFFFSEERFQKEMNAACERLILTENVLIGQLRNEKFDIIFAEQLNFCGAGLAHLLQIPTHILLSSCPIQEHVASLLGLPNPSSYVPSLFESNLPDKMSISQRFSNLLLQISGYTYFLFGLDPLTGIFRKHFGADFPDLRNIVKNSPIIFVNVDELVDFPRPSFPNIVYIGGLGMEEANGNGGQLELSEPFNLEMEKGAKGIVYFSLGTLVPTTLLPENFLKNIFLAFSQLPDYHFIVKIDKEDNISIKEAAKLKNVFLTNWTPQAQLFAHPRMQLFITHGGYNSLMEAARAGIPLIAMGFFADQYRNAQVAQRNGWGIAFEKKMLQRGSGQFREAIEEMLQNPKYKSNAKRIQRLIKNKPFSAEERLQKTIRFLELSGGKLPELQAESRNMGTLELYNLDLAILAAICLAILAISLKAFIHFILVKLAKPKTKVLLYSNGKNKSE